MTSTRKFKIELNFEKKNIVLNEVTSNESSVSSFDNINFMTVSKKKFEGINPVISHIKQFIDANILIFYFEGALLSIFCKEKNVFWSTPNLQN